MTYFLEFDKSGFIKAFVPCQMWQQKKCGLTPLIQADKESEMIIFGTLEGFFEVAGTIVVK